VVPISLHNNHWFLIKPCPLRPFPDWWFSVRPTLPEPGHVRGGLLTTLRKPRHVQPWPVQLYLHMGYRRNMYQLSGHMAGSTHDRATSQIFRLLARLSRQLAQHGWGRNQQYSTAMSCSRCRGNHPRGQTCPSTCTNTSKGNGREGWRPWTSTPADTGTWATASTKSGHGDTRCRQCNFENKAQGLIACSRCTTANLNAARRADLDTGKAFRMDSVALRITGLDINNPQMENHTITNGSRQLLHQHPIHIHTH
jgi:hypothetical protein